MKKILNYYILAFSVVAMASCTKGLEELNINQVNPTTLDPVLLLNNAIINTSFPTKTQIYEMSIVQQMVTPNGGVLAGGNFNQDIRDNNSIWVSYYQNVIKYTHDAISKTKDDAARSNLYNMARIWQAYAFMVLTDTYGAIPYFEGGAGLTDQILLPKYDQQQDIYPDLIKVLDEASAALNATGTVETSDLLYAGNVEKWRKLGYSLLLRAGMRLSKIDASTAQAIAKKAADAGVIMLNEDNAYMRHDANYLNPTGNMLNSTEAANWYLVNSFIDTLKNNNDPRLQAIAIRYKGATSGPDQTVDKGSTLPDDQIGMAMGYDNGTIVAKAAADGLASFYDYSQVDRRRMAGTATPMFFVTASQTQLLLAEARYRGWITTGTAAQYFQDGIIAHMNQLATYGSSVAIAPADIDAYITAHPLAAGKELEQINTQYWISSFLNGPETFANFRRSGYPALAPNPYGQPNNPDVPNGTFIRRIGYPTSELSINTENVNAAISAMGADKLSTHLWWDK
ncbi:MAG TPA: SusD/RagB family nutrient-binding outer membrane lipoprotein [Parafilimonas sp.]|nr:SusD/RagB family nutrient-binding outer membrane lipoprotein [Parafilimonas sp.]